MKVTVIAGDSIIKHLQGWRLSDTDNHVVVKSFSGSTIEDMEDYLKPVIRKEPESIVLHIGTNDLNKLSPKQVADSITNLGIQINEESPNTAIVISSILLRTDKPAVCEHEYMNMCPLPPVIDFPAPLIARGHCLQQIPCHN